MEMRRLRYFVGITDAGSIGRAAMRLNIAQPALSRQLRMLEGDLGVQLFERGTRGLTLTAAGEVFLTKARAVLSAYADACGEAKAAAQGRAGRLRVGFIAAAAREGFLPQAIQSLLVDHPGLELQMYRMRSDEALAGVQSGELDVGIFHHRPEMDTSLDFVAAHTDRYLLALPSNRRLNGETAVCLADLTDEPFVWYPQPPGSSYGRLVEACRAGGLSLNVIQEAESQEILLELVAMGLGATFVASSIAGHETLRNVVLKEVADLTAMFALEVVWRRDNPKPLLATFTEAVTNVLRKKEADVTDQREPDLATS